jgi:hypothetical protein
LQHFDWADNTLFFDQIPNATDPRKTAIFLGAHDIIIDAAVSISIPHHIKSHDITQDLTDLQRTRKYLEERE